MRYIFLLITVAIIYVVLTRSSAVDPAAQAIQESMQAAEPAPAPATASAAATPAPHTNAYKAPLDRTHAVLDQVRKQNGGSQF